MNEGATPRTVPGDRWACSACGDCCRLYTLGPVEPAVVASLAAARIGERWAPAAAGWVYEAPGPDGAPRHFLRHVDGHCVFLREDRLCAVHDLLGEAAKPGFCREYPYHLVERGPGAGGAAESAVVVRPSCSGYARSFTTGPPVAEAAPGAAALPRVLPPRRPMPTRVELAPGVVAPFEAWASVEERLLAAPFVTVAGGLDAIRDALVEAGAPPFTPDPARAALAFGAVVEGIRRLMAHAATDPEDVDPHRRAFAAETEAWLRAALPRLRAPAPLAPDAEAWMVAQLRAFLLARWYLGLGGPPPWVAEGFAVYTVGLALVRAAAEAPTPVTAALAGPGVVRWTRLIENRAVLDLLRRARPALWDGWQARARDG